MKNWQYAKMNLGLGGILVFIFLFAGIGQAIDYPDNRDQQKIIQNIRKIESALAHVPNDIQLNKKLGIYWHAKAAAEYGVLADAENSEKRFKSTLLLAEKSVKPDKNLINNLKGWQGAALALKPKFKLSLLDTIRASNTGTRLLDRAVYDNPADLELRYVRANTYIYYPPNLGKMKLVIDDAQYLLSAAKGKTAKTDPAVLKLYAMLAFAYHENRQPEQAKQYLAILKQLAPQSDYYKEAQKLCSN